jgi:hypothetical protein
MLERSSSPPLAACRGSNMLQTSSDWILVTRSKMKGAELLYHQHGTEMDSWAWAATFADHKGKKSNTIGLQQYDISKFTRAQRAGAAYNGKDPLTDVFVKGLKKDLLDFV